MKAETKFAIAVAAVVLGLTYFGGPSVADDAKPDAPATQPAKSNAELNLTNCMLGKSAFHRVGFGEVSFTDASLAGAKFDDVNLGRASFENINLKAAKFHNINLSGATFDDVNFADVDIDHANLAGMKINGILVTDLLAAYEKARP